MKKRIQVISTYVLLILTLFTVLFVVLDKHHITYPVLLDESGNIFSQYDGDMFPTLYFIDSKGDIIDEIIGSTDIESIERSFISLQENFNE